MHGTWLIAAFRPVAEQSSNTYTTPVAVFMSQTPFQHQAMLSRVSNKLTGRLAGISLMLFGIWLFSFGDALGKYIVATYSVGQLLLLRAFSALILLSPMIW